ncbi:AMP-binding protein [Nocardia spumae]|uniref:AMP-binding protein n=1 Tax=Nocardia spumae TaxID=2887190 RepID=UPI001D15B171|nr:AMP-binding protein [Nocardia spumae]
MNQPLEGEERARPSLVDLLRAVASAVGDREAVVHGDVRRTYAQTVARIDALARMLVSRRGSGVIGRGDRAGMDSGQGNVAVYMYNGPEYIEATFAALGARYAPFNVNYRYTPTELTQIFDDARPAVIVYHACFAPTLAQVLPGLAVEPLLIQVADDSGRALLPGAVEFEAALLEAPEVSLPTSSPDDLLLVYTGGTTGLPKGVMWGQHDMWLATSGGAEFPADVTAAAVGESARQSEGPRLLGAAPFMHGAGLWYMVRVLVRGGLVAIPATASRFDAAEVCELIERERLDTIVLVAEAFANPLVRQVIRRSYRLDCVRLIGLGGGMTSAQTKDALMTAMPHAALFDSVGCTETGGILREEVLPGEAPAAGVFRPLPRACVISEDKRSFLAPGSSQHGWLAARTPLPRGYLHDPAKSATALIDVAGDVVMLTGDRVEYLGDSRVKLLGRDSMTINTGGEKVFAEEVERAARVHPSVQDVLVLGRPHERWGQVIVAVVQLDEPIGDDDLLAAMAGRIARYKLPKAFIRVEQIRRSAAGKADYQWAESVVRQEGVRG